MYASNNGPFPYKISHNEKRSHVFKKLFRAKFANKIREIRDM
jgi:hypothetical protein